VSDGPRVVSGIIGPSMTFTDRDLIDASPRDRAIVSELRRQRHVVVDERGFPRTGVTYTARYGVPAITTLPERPRATPVVPPKARAKARREDASRRARRRA